MMNVNIYELIAKVKDKLTGIDGIKSVKIGLEPNISPSEYPIIRIVINRNTIVSDYDQWANDVFFSVYFGAKIDEKVGIENIYKGLD